VRGREIGGDFWGAVAIGEGLLVLQTIVGIILVLQHRMPARPLHFVYGGVALLVWPAVFAFPRGDASRRAGLWWLRASSVRVGGRCVRLHTGGYEPACGPVVAARQRVPVWRQPACDHDGRQGYLLA